MVNTTDTVRIGYPDSPLLRCAKLYRRTSLKGVEYMKSAKGKGSIYLILPFQNEKETFGLYLVEDVEVEDKKSPLIRITKLLARTSRRGIWHLKSHGVEGPKFLVLPFPDEAEAFGLYLVTDKADHEKFLDGNVR